jgi:cell division protein FtsB
MPRRPVDDVPDPDAFSEASDDPNADGHDSTNAADSAAVPNLSALPIVTGITRRRIGTIVALAVAVWIAVAVGRQVSDATAATHRAEIAADRNVALLVEVEALERELRIIQRQAYVEQQARGYGLGGPGEIAFTLADDAPPLPADAPGSASVRLGATTERVTPLERWLSLLFGSDG